MRALVAILGLLLATQAWATPQELVVAMTGSGKLERYEATTGAWLGTLASTLPTPNGLALAPKGDLLVSCGASGQPGSVHRFDSATGRDLGDFIPPTRGQPGSLLRPMGMALWREWLIVASYDDGVLKCYDAVTGQWLRDLANPGPGRLTQLMVAQDKLYVPDYSAGLVLSINLPSGEKGANIPLPAACAPWGIEAMPGGELVVSGSDGAVRIGHKVLAGPSLGLKSPAWLAFSKEDGLFLSDLGAQLVMRLDPQGGIIWTRRGTEVRTPAGLVLAGPFPLPKPPLRLFSPPGGIAVMPSAEDTPAVALRIEASPEGPCLTALGWDTEGGDQARLNLLRDPARVLARYGEEWLDTGSVTCLPQQSASAVIYKIPLRGEAWLEWRVGLRDKGLTWSFRLQGGPAPDELRLLLPFDPSTTATSLIAEDWKEGGEFQLPAIISAPDCGQLLVTCKEEPRATGWLTGSRPGKRVDVSLRLPLDEAQSTCSLRFDQVVLPRPAGVAPELWRIARRGWFNLYQVSAEWPPEAPFGGAPGGLLSNNVISDPVSSLFYCYSDPMLLVPELAPGVSAAAVVRRSLEYWLTKGCSEEGYVFYVPGGGGDMADSNPSILMGAWAYVEATDDEDWLSHWLPRLELVASYMATRDVDGDGLIESRQSGNTGTKLFGDTYMDTISSGHKNALTNALSYRGWLCLADLEARMGRECEAQQWRALAKRLKATYGPCFMNPATGWLGWWRSADGHLHDYAALVVNAVAVECHVLDLPLAREVMARLWTKLEEVGFDCFSVGVPNNLIPVRRDDQFASYGGQSEDGSDTFPTYCNGGVFTEDAVRVMIALWRIGEDAKAELILQSMLKRQEEGYFPNGGGFQTGVTNVPGTGSSISDWQGRPTEYEGSLSHDYSFLSGVLLRLEQYRQRVYRPLLTY